MEEAIMAKDFISDAEMMDMEKGGQSQPATSGAPDFISDADMDKLAPPSQPFTDNVIKPVANAAKWVGDKYGSYVTGPTRAAIKEELDNGASAKPISAFWNQMGRPESTAPRGAEIAEKVGVPNRDISLHSKEPSPGDPDYYRYHNDPIFR